LAAKDGVPLFSSLPSAGNGICWTFGRLAHWFPMAACQQLAQGSAIQSFGSSKNVWAQRHEQNHGVYMVHSRNLKAVFAELQSTWC